MKKHIHCENCGISIETEEIGKTYCYECNKATEKYKDIEEIANNANSDNYPEWKEESELSEDLHGDGCCHPMIGEIYRADIRRKEIEKVKDKLLRDRLFKIEETHHNIIMNCMH